MTMQESVQKAASGDNMLTHVASVSTLGAALASIASWGFQIAHIMPPPDATAGMGVIFAVFASWIFQKMSA